MLVLLGYLGEPYAEQVAVRSLTPEDLELKNGKLSEEFLLDILSKVPDARDELLVEWANELTFPEIEKLLEVDYFLKTFSGVCFNWNYRGDCKWYFFPSWYLDMNFYLKKFESYFEGKPK
jgi:hypothetical protein